MDDLLGGADRPIGLKIVYSAPYPNEPIGK